MSLKGGCHLLDVSTNMEKSRLRMLFLKSEENKGGKGDLECHFIIRELSFISG